MVQTLSQQKKLLREFVMCMTLGLHLLLSLNGLNFSHFHSIDTPHFGVRIEKNERNRPSSSGGARIIV